jgi:hypothetical protein
MEDDAYIDAIQPGAVPSLVSTMNDLEVSYASR